MLVAVILVVACLSKRGTVLLGAKAAGMEMDSEAWAIAFGLNARGATGIVVAGVGLTNGVKELDPVRLTAALTGNRSRPAQPPGEGSQQVADL